MLSIFFFHKLCRLMIWLKQVFNQAIYLCYHFPRFIYWCYHFPQNRKITFSKGLFQTFLNYLINPSYYLLRFRLCSIFSGLLRQINILWFYGIHFIPFNISENAISSLLLVGYIIHHRFWLAKGPPSWHKIFDGLWFPQYGH